jgi:hypothetical protein
MRLALEAKQGATLLRASLILTILRSDHVMTDDSSGGDKMDTKILQDSKSFILGTLFILLFSSFGSSTDYLFSVSGGNTKCTINVVDPSDASIEAVKIIQVPGTWLWCDRFATGLAADPSTGNLWAVVQYWDFVADVTARGLLTLNPNTGAVAFIGTVADNFSAIAFNADGSVLYGLTGQGATTPEMLYTLNKTNASKTQVCSLSNGNSGESLAFNTADNYLYHGSLTANSPVFTPVFEKVTSLSPGACGVSSITVSGETVYEMTALGYAGSGSFYLTSWGDLYNITDSGAVTSIGTLAGWPSVKGLTKTAAILDYANLAITYAGCKRSKKSDLIERITVSNQGSTAATDAVLTIISRNGMSLVSDTLPDALGCTYVNEMLTCDLGDIPAGSEINFDVNWTVTFKRNSELNHSLRVSSDEWETYDDSLDNFQRISGTCKQW